MKDISIRMLFRNHIYSSSIEIDAIIAQCYFVICYLLIRQFYFLGFLNFYYLYPFKKTCEDRCCEIHAKKSHGKSSCL